MNRPTRPLSRRERPSKSALSREVIIKVALGILKKEGLEKVTMRRIAQALDTGPASLYVYVHDTRDLHAQILEAFLAELPAPKPGPRWRRDLWRVAEAYLAVLMRYPEIARLTMAAVPTGPNALRLFEVVAGLLLEAGVQKRAAAWGVDLVLAYVTSTAIEQGGERASNELTELTQVLERLEAHTHPHLAKLRHELVSGAGDERFRWGLDVLINGLLHRP